MPETKTALKTAPKGGAYTSKDVAKGLTRVSPGIFRNEKGQLVNYKGTRINASGQKLKEGAKEEGKKDAAPKAPPTPTGAADPTPVDLQTPGQQVTNVQTETDQSLMDLFGQLQSQGAFNPGSYDDSYQAAARNVMEQFEGQNAQQFALEAEGMEEMIAQRGLDPAGRQAERLRTQMAQNQGGLRRQAQLAAEQAGRTVQQQQFEQDLIKYNVPADQINKLGGLFAGQLGSVEAQRQREFEAQQNKLAREQALKISQKGGGADPFALMAAEYGYKRDLLYDTAALQGQGGGGGNSIATGFAGGFGQGFGAGLGSSLGRR